MSIYLCLLNIQDIVNSRKGIFNIDSDANISFENLTCFGYDLPNDPKRRHKIKPFLHGPDGLSKRVKLPFAENIRKDERFHRVHQNKNLERLDRMWRNKDNRRRNGNHGKMQHVSRSLIG